MKNSFKKINFILSQITVLLISGLMLFSCTTKKNSDATSIVGNYPIVDTNQGLTYNNIEQINPPDEGDAFYGQDAQYTGNSPSYTDNGDGTITDNVTGIIWAQDLSTSAFSWVDASNYTDDLVLGEHTDWRLPTVKELWSIRDFSQGWPWVDTDYFHLVGDGSDQRQHHSWSSNAYLVESEYQNEQVVGDPAFIVNDWTGHIKAMSGNRFVRAVRGNTNYGINNFVDNGDATVTDKATGLMWSQNDSGKGMNWNTALVYAEADTTSGYDDWRLPNAKELQSIADYSGVFPSINTSMFNLTKLTNIKGQDDYPFYWSSTSNPVEGSDGAVDMGSVYAWVLAAGYNTDPDGYDLHGSGSVVFTPKSEEYFTELDPEIHRYNYVRLVRAGNVTKTPNGDPSCVNEDRVVSFPDGDTGMGGHGGGQRPDFTTAATKLGITEEELINALGDDTQGPPDFAAVAEALGITEEELEVALMNSNNAPEGNGPKVDMSKMISVDEANALEAKLIGAVSYSAAVDGYPIIDTNQTLFFSNDAIIDKPAVGDDFYGQDASFTRNAPSYIDNGDGTITDNVTGLIWQQDPGEKLDWEDAVNDLVEFNEEALGGYTDWRIPTIKELYSLVDFSGSTRTSSDTSTPYIDTDYFVFLYGDEAGEPRFIDSQILSTTIYNSTTLGGNTTVFGYNFADGRIKGYEITKNFYCYHVRGNTNYGQNLFVDNGDETITDEATSLMWMKDDSANYEAGTENDGTLNWQEALEWVKEMNTEEFLGYSDWRLPNVKELQSIVDYSKSPITTDSPAIDDLFTCTPIINCFGEEDYGYFWSSTTHDDTSASTIEYNAASYVVFGNGMGTMDGEVVDAHGSGSQKSDPKTGDRNDYPAPDENAPQGDEQRVFNMVRLVRDAD